jgi:hypothetical protein
MKSKKVFFNRAQQYVIHMAVRILFVIASRRLGKSEGIIMPTLLRNVQHMPRGQHAIVSTTYKQALTRTLPGTFHAMNRLGYIEGIHYYVGRKAPEKLVLQIHIFSQKTGAITFIGTMAVFHPLFHRMFPTLPTHLRFLH